MGAIGGLLGVSGGANGTGFSGPQSAGIQSGTNADQLASSYAGNQNSLASQQALLTALQGQNGLGNQSQVYNQLQGVANGTGPNPAQAMLNQQTGANVANQAALMASQRGASANPALLARQAAQQGAATQQQAVGQGATMQANQALNALGAAGNMATQQAQQQIGATNANTAAQQQEQQILQNANTAANRENVAMQSNMNNVNAGLANTTMQGQQALVGGAMQGLGAAVGMAGGGEVPDSSDSDEPQSSFGKFLSGAGAPMAGSGNAGAQALQQGAAGLGAGIGKALKPGPATPMTDAGFKMPEMGSQFAGTDPSLGASTSFGGTAPAAQGPSLGVDTSLSNAVPAYQAPSLVAGAFNHGGRVPALVSPGEKYLSPQEARDVAAKKKSPTKAGETVPGKARVKGDSTKNDTVPALLEPGGVVVKRSVMNSKDPDEKAAKFVQAVLAKKKARS